jgi:hypothetical protein
MAGILDFPTVVQEALQHFGDLLPNEPQRRHFAEYLTGLFVAERKNVCGINREFAQTTDQSCLNRFLTEADWDGKQQLGMGDCQLRDGAGQTRHMHLVMLAYSLLMRQLRQGHAYEWAYRKLTTIGEACCAILCETLRQTLSWALERGSSNPYWTKERVIAHLGLS